MHYPFWYVPFLTSPMLIAVVAVFHIFVALYAVGGGLFLAVETSFAYRRNNRQYLDYLKSHAYFFILVTVVYGAITGVGIWWTISLASPLATEFLIHIFVFGWAMEYVFFILEIVSAFLFFYGWDILPPKIHQRIGWIYAVSAWISLVLITGILAFMLNPLPWDGGFWRAFLNPQTVPQIIIRTGGSVLLAMLYVYVHACIFSKSAHIKELVARRSSYYVAVGALMLLVGGAGWFFTLPQSAKVALTSAPALIILSSIIGVLCGILFFIFYLGPYRNPSWMNPAIALVLFFMGLIVTGASEFVREAVRKPFVIYNQVYSHNVYPSEIPLIREKGFLESGVWTKRYVENNFPSLMNPDGTIDESKIDLLPDESQNKVGEAIFMYHCASCHSVQGHMGMKELLVGWKPHMLDSLILNLSSYSVFMPPWSGTKEEAVALRKYLQTIAPAHPIVSQDKLEGDP